jgi:hypothetical protein
MIGTASQTRKMAESAIEHFIIYDTRDGSVQHRHTVVTYAGAEPLATKAGEKRALELAAQVSRLPKNAACIRLMDSEFDSLRKYKVDLKSQRLVELKPVERSKRMSTKRKK